MGTMQVPIHPFTIEGTDMAKLHIDIRETHHGIIVRLTGEAAHGTADALQSPLTRLMAQRPPLVVFDLAEIVCVASLVLGMLVSFRRALIRHGGQVKLAALQPLVRETFEAAGLLALFAVAGTVDEALGVKAQEQPASAGGV